MSLTKNDLNQIEKIVSTKVDELAEITAHGFSEVHSKLKEHDKEFAKINHVLKQHDKEFAKINQALDNHSIEFRSIQSELISISNRVGELENKIDRLFKMEDEDTRLVFSEIEKLKKRIKAIEIKVVSPAKA